MTSIKWYKPSKSAINIAKKKENEVLKTWKITIGKHVPWKMWNIQAYLDQWGKDPVKWALTWKKPWTKEHELTIKALEGLNLVKWTTTQAESGIRARQRAAAIKAEKDKKAKSAIVGKYWNKKNDWTYSLWTKIKSTPEQIYKNPNELLKWLKLWTENTAYWAGKILDIPSNIAKKRLTNTFWVKFNNDTRNNIDRIHNEVSIENKASPWFEWANFVWQLWADTVWWWAIKAWWWILKTVGKHALAWWLDTSVREWAKAVWNHTNLKNYALTVLAWSLSLWTLWWLTKFVKPWWATNKILNFFSDSTTLKPTDIKLAKSEILRSKAPSSDKIKAVRELDKTFKVVNWKVSLKNLSNNARQRLYASKSGKWSIKWDSVSLKDLSIEDRKKLYSNSFNKSKKSDIGNDPKNLPLKPAIAETPSKWLWLHTNIFTRTLWKWSYQLSKNSETKKLAWQLLKWEIDREALLKYAHNIATKINKQLWNDDNKLVGNTLREIWPWLVLNSEWYNHSWNVIKLLKSGLNNSQANIALKVMDYVHKMINASLHWVNPKKAKKQYDFILKQILNAWWLSDIVSKTWNQLSSSVSFKEAEEIIKSLIPNATKKEIELLHTFLNDAKWYDDKFDKIIKSASWEGLITVSNVLSWIMSSALLWAQFAKQLLMAIPDVFRSIWEVWVWTTLRILKWFRSPNSKRVLDAMWLNTEWHYLDVNNSQSSIWKIVKASGNALLYWTYVVDQHIVKPLLALWFHDAHTKNFKLMYPDKTDNEIFDMATNAALVDYSNRWIISRKIGSSAIHNNKSLQALTNLTRYVWQMWEMIYTHPIDSTVGSTIKQQSKALINSIKNREVWNTLSNLLDVISSPIWLYVAWLYATTELVHETLWWDFTYYWLSESDPVIPFKITKVSDGTWNFNSNYEIQALTFDQSIEKLWSWLAASWVEWLWILGQTTWDVAKYWIWKLWDLTGSETMKRVWWNADFRRLSNNDVNLSKYDLWSYPQLSQFAQSDFNKFFNPLAWKQISNWFEWNWYQKLWNDKYRVPSFMWSTQVTDKTGKLSKQYLWINPSETSYENTSAINALNFWKEQDAIKQSKVNTWLDILKQTQMKWANKKALEANFKKLPQYIQNEAFKEFAKYNADANTTTYQNAVKSLSPENQAKFIDFQRSVLNKWWLDRFNAEMWDLQNKWWISPKVYWYLNEINKLKSENKYRPF